MVDWSALTIQTVVPAGSALIAVGAYITTIKVYGKRITKLEDECMRKDVCGLHSKSLENIRADIQYLRERLDHIAERVCK
jgi:hypothetical protein